VATRIDFVMDPDISYPLMQFDAIAALNDVQAEQVLRMMKHPLVKQILDGEVQAMDAGDDGVRGVGPSASVHVLRPAGKKDEAAAAEPAKPTSVQAQPALDPAAQRIKDLEEQLAAARKQPEPEPELTPEQKRIKDLEDQLAAAKAGAPAKEAKPRGRPKGVRTPQVAPTNMDSATLAGPPLPEPVGEPAVPTAANGQEDPIAKINKTLAGAKDLL